MAPFFKRPKLRSKREDRELYAKVAALGCCICKTPNEVHHKTGGGMAKKSDQVMPLCPLHHRLGNKGVAIHAGVETWEEIHGTQDYWIKQTQELLDDK